MDAQEKDFHDSLIKEGMEYGSHAVAAAMRAFDRWRRLPRLSWSRDGGVNFRSGTAAEYEADIKANGPVRRSEP